jgi:hypothetical protein
MKGSIRPKLSLSASSASWPWRFIFELDTARAREIAKQVGKAVSKWRNEAAGHGITKNEIDRMASAFEHEDLKEALRG